MTQIEISQRSAFSWEREIVEPRKEAEQTDDSAQLEWLSSRQLQQLSLRRALSIASK
jgi:hypothetical protein